MKLKRSLSRLARPFARGRPAFLQRIRATIDGAKSRAKELVMRPLRPVLTLHANIVARIRAAMGLAWAWLLPVRAFVGTTWSWICFGWSLIRSGGAWIIRITARLWSLSRSVLRLLWKFKRPIAGLSMVAIGAAGYYYGGIIQPWQSRSEYWYNFALDEIQKDMKATDNHPWTNPGRFQNPELPRLNNALQAFKEQANASIIDRILYGRPDVELLYETLLKEAVIIGYNVGNDKDTEKKIQKVKELLEAAIKLNPGAPYNRDLGLTIADIDRLGFQSLSAIRNLEMLYERNPQSRSKPKDSNKQGQGKDQQSSRNGNQKGQADKPSTAPAQQPDKGKNDQDGQHAENPLLQQNLKDIQGAPSSDGI